MATLKTDFETLMVRLKKEGKVKEMPASERKTLFSGILAEMATFSAEDKRMQHDSLTEMASFFLTD